MGNKVERYSSSLEKCRKNIEKTKKYIEYHKRMLRVYEAKESRLVARLDDQKLAALRKSISQNGLDLDEICSAVANGEFELGKSGHKKPDKPAPEKHTDSIINDMETEDNDDED